MPISKYTKVSKSAGATEIHRAIVNPLARILTGLICKLHKILVTKKEAAVVMATHKGGSLS